MLARLLLAILATSGLYYVNIMPALVDGLKQGLGFTNREAGLVSSCNVYGAALGGFLVAFLIRHLKWRTSAYCFLIGLIGMDLLSMLATTPFTLMGLRLVHGTMGGMLVGVGISMMARTQAPDRSFGMFLTIETFAGGVGIMVLPLLVRKYSSNMVFLALIVFSVLALVLLQFVPEPTPVSGALTKQTRDGGLPWSSLVLALSATFLFQAANMGIFAYLIGLGRHHGLEIGYISRSLGIAGWVSALGSVLVIVISTRFGIFKPIFLGTLVCLLAYWAFNYCEAKWIWITANFVSGIAWNFVISHLLGMCARFDDTGQIAVWSGFASKMGLASGPLVAALIVGTSNYASVVWMTVILIGLSMILSAMPARILDRTVFRKPKQVESTPAVAT
jgi:predicted MFS family arabinose efflux permease